MQAKVLKANQVEKLRSKIMLKKCRQKNWMANDLTAGDFGWKISDL